MSPPLAPLATHDPDLEGAAERPRWRHSIAIRLSIIFGAMALLAIGGSLFVMQALFAFEQQFRDTTERLLPSFSEMNALSAAANAVAEAVPQLARAAPRVDRAAVHATVTERVLALRILVQRAKAQGIEEPEIATANMSVDIEDLDASTERYADATLDLQQRRAELFSFVEKFSELQTNARLAIAECRRIDRPGTDIRFYKSCLIKQNKSAVTLDDVVRIEIFSTQIDNWSRAGARLIQDFLALGSATTVRTVAEIERSISEELREFNHATELVQVEYPDLKWPSEFLTGFSTIRADAERLSTGPESMAATTRAVLTSDLAQNYYLAQIMKNIRLVADVSEFETNRLREESIDRIAISQAELSTLKIKILAMVYFLVLLSMFAIMYSQFGVRRRMLRLVDGVGAAYDREIGTIPTEGRDEIGILGRALRHFAAAAQRRETWLREVLDTSPTAVAVVDAERTVQLVSRSGVGLLTRDGEDVGAAAASWTLPLLTPDPGDGGGAPAPIDGRLIEAPVAGQTRWLSVTTLPTLFAGRPATLVWAHDLTGRIAADAEIARTKAMLETAIEAIDVGVMLVDLDLRVVLISSRARALLNVAPEVSGPGTPIHLIATTPRNATMESFLDGAVYERTMPSGRIVEYRNGSARHGDYLVRTYIDVTERRRSELRLAKSQELIRSIAENLPGAIFRIEHSPPIGFTLAFASAGLEKMCDNSLDDLVGTPGRGLDFLPIGHRLRVSAALLMALVQDENRVDLEYNYEQGGTEYWVQLLGSAVVLSNGDGVWNGVLLDATEWRKADQAKRAFISTVSHELRTPLASIRGSLGLIAGGTMGELPDRTKRLIDIAANNCTRLTRLINDILDIEKIESERMQFKMEPHDLTTLIQRSIEDNRGYGVDRGIGLVAEIDRTSQIVVDSDRFAQVMANLISNAVKFSPDNASVKITTETKPRNVRISVSDVGPGIPVEFRSRIFGQFTQADNSDTRARGGTGLGLAISKVIVERLGGHIHFETELGVGTTFHVDLPIVEDTKAAPYALIVEDDAAMATLLAELVGHLGSVAKIAPNLATARRMLVEGRPSLVLLDLLLPDGNGLDLLGDLGPRGGRAEVPTLIVSGTSAPVGLEPGTSPVLGWVSKPFDVSSMLQQLGPLLGTAEQGRPRILHVEDDADIAAVVAASLSDIAQVIAVPSLAQARAALQSAVYDVILLDLGLPDGDGAELIDLVDDLSSVRAIVVFSASDPSPDLSERVSKVLVKGRSSVDDVARWMRGILLAPAANSHGER